MKLGILKVEFLWEPEKNNNKIKIKNLYILFYIKS